MVTGRTTLDVLIVDDHDLVRSGIRNILEGAPALRVVGEAVSGEEAVKLAKELRPDVILMDLKMPGMGGLEATRKISRFDSGVKILVITMCDDVSSPNLLFDAGAHGYMTKDSDRKTILNAIRQVICGQRYISPELSQKMALARAAHQEPSPFENLSKRELQVAMMIIQGEKTEQIASTLHLSGKTINSYRYRIFKKLRVDGDLHMMRLALKFGLLASEDLARAAVSEKVKAKSGK